jgi:hypothetical protein
LILNTLYEVRQVIWMGMESSLLTRCITIFTRQ